MAHHSPLAVVLVSCALLSPGAARAQETAPEPLSLAERAYRASRVYAAVMTYFAHWPDAPDGVAIEAAHRAYVESALAAGDRLSFSRASMRFLATFRNAHTLLLDRPLATQVGPMPIDARYLGGRWVITASTVSGLRAGDVVETIDGQPFEAFFRGQRPLVSASTEHWARRAPFTSMPGFAPYACLFPARFTLGLLGGRQVQVDRKAQSGLEQGGRTEGRWLEPGRLAYIRVPSFFGPEFEKRAIELVREYGDAPALIVDVRGNAGGSTPSELTERLMDRPRRWWTESTPASLPFFRLRAAQGSWEYMPFDRPELLWRAPASPPGKEAYRGRLALLVDDGCLSSCEDFAMPFKDNARAVLVGQTTGGSSGQPYLLDLGDGMLLLVGAKREMFPDGSRFEGVGIRPDLEVVPTVDDIRAGRDVVLEAARQRLAAPPAPR